jgi:predicted ATPase
MLRELAEALDVLTAEQPLVLVLEDLHWSDGATLEWLAYVARRRDPARLLVLGTYRPAEALVPAHPLRHLVRELQHHGRGVELRLDYLSVAGVTAYLRHRFPTHSWPEGLSAAVQQRTNGNPFFLVALVDEMVRHNVLSEQAAPWRPPGEHETWTIEVPESLRQLIEQQLDQVSPDDQLLLEAASITGATFAIAAVAAGSEQSAEAIEARCDAWARQGRFVRAGELEAWPDGTVTARYHFIHALYHEVLYNRVSPGRRMRLHRQIGTRKELGYGARSQEIAAELAVHFLRGHDPNRAVQYLHAAAENALRRSAYPEAVSHLTTGLEVLHTLPDTPERRRYELAMRTTLGPALVATQGYTAPEVERVYTRASQLCQQAGEVPERFPVLWGLWLFYNNRGALSMARELGEQLLALAHRTGEPEVLLQAHHAMGNTLFWCGEFAAAHVHMDQALALYDPEQHGLHALRYGGHDPGVCCLGHGAIAWWIRGYPDQALRRGQHALRLAQQLAHPSTQVHALLLATRVHLARRERLAVLTHTETIVTLATAQGFRQPWASGTLRQGWALVAQGEQREGMAQLHQGLSTLRTIGAANALPAYLATYAEACGQAGQSQAGLTALDEALRLAHGDGGREYTAELYRLRGELLLLQSPDYQAEALSLFYRALNIAQHQQAKAWELRIAMSLSRLEQQGGKREESHKRLESVYNWFTEGFETADLLEAKALLR